MTSPFTSNLDNIQAHKDMVTLAKNQVFTNNGGLYKNCGLQKACWNLLTSKPKGLRGQKMASRILQQFPLSTQIIEFASTPF